MSNETRWQLGDEPQQEKAPQTPMQKQQSQDRGGLDSLLKPTAVASRGGVATTKVKELFEEISTTFRAKSNEGKEIYVCIADEAPLRVPAIILYCVNGNEIYSFPMILEACGEKLEPRQINGQNGRPILVDMPTSRYYAGTMESICVARVQSDAVARGKVKGNANVLPLGYIVIKRNVNLEDKNNLSAFFDSANAAFSARVNTSLSMPTCPLVASQINNRNIQLVARHRLTPGASDIDVFGNVVYQDFRIELVAREADRTVEDLHKAGREIMLSAVTGYVDFAYHNPSVAQQQQAAQQRMVQSPFAAVNIPAYDPYIVITSATPLGAATVLGDSILTQCFALASVTGIAQGQRWVPIFAKTGLDTNKKASIGAFCLEHDPAYIKQENPQILPVSAGMEPVLGSNMFTPLEIVNKFCYPTMVVAMDIEEGSPMSWVQSIFGRAKPGSTEEAIIIKELDSFSDGVFSKLWDRRQPILAYDTAMIHLGNYTSSDGHKRDIRSLDYLSALTYSNGELSIMGPYSEGFQPGHSTAETMHAKREIIKSAFPNVEFTGIAARVFYNTAFISALEQMFATVNMRIMLEGITDINNNIGRITAFDDTFNNTMVGHGAFHQNYGMPQNNTPLMNAFGGTSFFRN